MQPPVLPRTHTQEKTRTPHEVRENASFSEVVDILENARVAGTGFELPFVFNGKTYILQKTGDAGGIILSKRVLSNRLNRGED